MIPSSIKCPEAADLPSGYGKSLAAAPICSRQAFFIRPSLFQTFPPHVISGFLCVSLSHTAARPLGSRRLVKAGIESIKVPAVQTVLEAAQGFTESLEMNDFSFTKKTDRVSDFRVFDNAENIVICQTGFLFRRHIFVKVGDCITCALELACTKRFTTCSLRPNGKCVVNIIFIKSGGFDFFWCKIFCKLSDDSCNDFKVSKFFSANISKGSHNTTVNHAVALGKIT